MGCLDRSKSLPTNLGGIKRPTDVKNSAKYFTRSDWERLKYSIENRVPEKVEKSFNGKCGYSVCSYYQDDPDAVDFGKWMLSIWVDSRWPNNVCGFLVSQSGERCLREGFEHMREFLYNGSILPLPKDEEKQMSIFDIIA